MVAKTLPANEFFDQMIESDWSSTNPFDGFLNGQSCLIQSDWPNHNSLSCHVNNQFWFLDNISESLGSPVWSHRKSIWISNLLMAGFCGCLFDCFRSGTDNLRDSHKHVLWLSRKKKLRCTRITYTHFAVDTIFSLNIFCEKISSIS